MCKLATAACLLLVLGVPTASAQQPMPRALTISVLDTAGVGMDGARLILLPGKRIARTGADGLYTFAQLKRGTYRLQVNRFGFSPFAVDVLVPDSGAMVKVELSPLPQQIEAAVISDRREQLPRVYERQRKHLGHVLFAEDLPQYQAFGVSDLLTRVPRFYALLTATKSCRSTHVYVDGLQLPFEWKLDDYVKPQEIAAIEVHSSADFVKEDFLVFKPDPPTPAPTQRLGAINLGTPPPRVFQSLTGTCGRVIMIWTWWYRARH